MKFCCKLSSPEIITLECLYQNGFSHRLRQRAHIILMSNSRIKIDDISLITSLDRDTVSKIINNWEDIGLRGLYDAHKSGRPPIFSEFDENIIIEKIEAEPRSLKKITNEINLDTNKNASTSTVKRILKKRIKSGKG
jgi:transposase